MENKGFVFLRSYYDAMNDYDLDNEQKGIFLDAICQYVFDDVEPQFEKGVMKGFWTSIKPTIDGQINRYRTSVENGKKGGAPKGNSNAKKTTQEQPEINLKTTQEQPNINLKGLEKNNLKKEIEIEIEIEKEKEIEKEIENKNEIDNWSYDELLKYRKAKVEVEKPKQKTLQGFY